ncbi:response regulator transcription factor [uncultured Flavobacterium sp.]|uniref:response regulator transcription factor n=1 Tax=uncultured Flavobacterium sp. TaxID=165435 RepID=UPI0025D3B3FB|nr:response regulator transcription factor [uncultured Flavobacterium sp.]
MEKTAVAIIDDHKIVRQGLKELLQKVGPYEVICEFGSGLEFLEALPLERNPDIFILDYSMPGMDGIGVLKALEEREEEHRVLLLTQHFDDNLIDEAYFHGARGFLNKNCTAQELKAAIDAIVRIGYDNITEILKRMRVYGSLPRTEAQKIELSQREMEFLTLVCDERELTYDQMAVAMGLSVKSVESYRSALFEKFGIKSKVGLVLFSYRNQLTPPFI